MYTHEYRGIESRRRKCSKLHTNSDPRIPTSILHLARRFGRIKVRTCTFEGLDGNQPDNLILIYHGINIPWYLEYLLKLSFVLKAFFCFGNVSMSGNVCILPAMCVQLTYYTDTCLWTVHMKR